MILTLIFLSTLSYGLTLAVECNSRNLQIVQNLQCPSGYMGVGQNCSCPQVECRIAHARLYLPSAKRLFSTESRYCSRELGIQMADDMAKSHAFVRRKGYPVDIDVNECRLRNTHEEYNIRKVYHPCSVSIGKFMRFNSLLLFNQYASPSPSSKKYSQSQGGTMFDISYPFPWKWSQGISACGSGEGGDGHSKFSGWNCAFKDFSVAVQEAAENLKGRSENVFDKELINQLRRIKRTEPSSIVQIPIYGKILDLLTTPSDLVNDFIAKRLTCTNPRSSCQWNEHEECGKEEEELYLEEQQSPLLSVSMHMRHGDSCDFVVDTERFQSDMRPSERKYRRPCFSIDVYMKRLYELKARYGVRKVYLATDSQEMIDYVTNISQSENTKEDADFEFVYINISRRVFDYSNGWVDFYNTSLTEIVTFSAVADLNLMKKGDIFLGAFSSHFSKLSYYAMAGRQMQLPPFVSLDLPLGCDTVDDCSIADIMHRGQNVRDVIQWAPECLRKYDGGWLDSERDPCGIYI